MTRLFCGAVTSLYLNVTFASGQLWVADLEQMRGCVRPGGEAGGQEGTPSAGCSGARDLGLPQPERWTASRLVPVQLPGAQQAEAFVRAFLKRSMPRMSQQACEDQLQRKAVVLEYFTRRKRKEKRKRSKGLSAWQRRELHLFDITAEQQRYARLPGPAGPGALLLRRPRGGSRPSLGFESLSGVCPSVRAVAEAPTIHEPGTPGSRPSVCQLS